MRKSKIRPRFESNKKLNSLHLGIFGKLPKKPWLSLIFCSKLKRPIKINLKFWPRMSITGKITLLYGLVFSFVFIFTSSFFMVNTAFSYIKFSRGELEETAVKVADYIQSGYTVTNNILREMRTNKNEDIRVLIIARDISVVATTDEKNSFIPRAIMVPGMNAKSGTSRQQDFAGVSHDYRFVFEGKLYLVQVFKKYVREMQMLRFVSIIFIIGNMLGIVCTFLIGRYISKKLLQPIITISKTAERLSVEDLTARIDIDGPDDEIKKLKITLNDMIARLESSFNKQNQFISDASHELRTPISVIQGYANLIDRWGKSDSAILQESIDSIKAETQHMGELIRKLLFLAKDQQNRRQLQFQQLSLNSMAAEVVREFGVLEIEHSILLEEESEANIVGDYDLIKQMLWTFIENSIKYGKDGKVNILLRVYGSSDVSCIMVKDNGIGISKEDLPNIFERFYRADKSRSKDIPGSGLGLSIADWIIKQHGATAQVESTLGAGTEITISFLNK